MDYLTRTLKAQQVFLKDITKHASIYDLVNQQGDLLYFAVNSHAQRGS